MPACLQPVGKGRTITLDKPVTFIGRHPDCDVILSRSLKISRKHCCIAQVNETLVIRDLGSMNGIRVNGKRVKKENRLKMGDEVTIGDCCYVLQANLDANDPKRSNGKSSTGHEDRKRSPRKRKPDQDIPPTPPEIPAPTPPAIPEVSEENVRKDVPDSIPLASMDDEDEHVEFEENHWEQDDLDNDSDLDEMRPLDDSAEFEDGLS